MSDKERFTDEEVEQAFGVPKILRAYQPGDVVIIECDDELDETQIKRITEIFGQFDLKGIVLGPRMRVVAKEERG